MTFDSYSVRCWFKWPHRPEQKLAHVYEERITLWRAGSFEQAIELAEQEALEYASDGVEYLGQADAYHLFEAVELHGVEVYSLLRDSDLKPDAFLDWMARNGYRGGEVEFSGG